MARPHRRDLPGRPSRYETEAAFEIIARMEAGEFLHRICEDPHLPAESTVWAWVGDGRHPRFAEAFRRARTTQGHRWAAEVVEIADQSIAAKTAPEAYSYQLRVNARKWASGKAVPEAYGDRFQVERLGGGATVHIYLPGKENSGDRAKVIDGSARLEDEREDE